MLPQDPCICLPLGSDTVTRCNFKGFHRAVHSVSTLGNYDITIDNSDFAQACTVPLTSIAISFETTGRELVSLLDQVSRRTVSGSKKVLIPHRLVVRESTRMKK